MKNYSILLSISICLMFSACSNKFVSSSERTPQADLLAPDELQNRNIVEFGLRNTKKLALTFDDGPGSGTAKILDTLKKYNVKATFFAVGQNLKQNDDKIKELNTLAKRIVDEGHVLANHSYTHPISGALKLERYRNDHNLLIGELTDTHEQIIKYAPDKEFYYFRAPTGAWANDYGDITNQNDIIKKYIGPIFWNIGGAIQHAPDGAITDAADWDCFSKKKREIYTIDVCLSGYLAKIDQLKGGVVLMHDIHVSTAAMFEKMLPILVEQGYQFIKLDEIEELRNYVFKQNDEFFKERQEYFKQPSIDTQK